MADNESHLDRETVGLLATLSADMKNLTQAVEARTKEAERDRVAITDLQRQVDRMVVALENSTRQLGEFALIGKATATSVERLEERVRLLEADRMARERADGTLREDLQRRERKMTLLIGFAGVVPVILLVLKLVKP